jgi:TolB-like protein/DNA-binding winged helix-turn-helix (wHTH) protein/cytochrome c-type biogenesis protein CcmH/NrfG
MSESQYRFAEFQLDCASFELRRLGRAQKSERIPLERIPMELLILLLERQGSVVTRQEIVDRLWGKDVFVDTEHGINTAIRKVRQALKDDPDNPRFVHTVSGKGYRFVTEKNGRLETPELVEGRTPRTPSGPDSSARSLTTRDTVAPRRALTKRKTAIAIAALSLLAATLLVVLRPRLFPSTQAAHIHSLAVIPLANLSGDSAQDYFADGMTDELITALAKNRTLRVVSRTSAMQYKGVNRPVRDIARELNVDGILEGSIERTPTSVHMTVQLIYAPTDTHVWAESYDRDLNHAYSLPEELSQTIAKEVKVATSPPPAQRYISPEAHDAYLLGRYYWYADDSKKSRTYFEKAIELQPDYAAAWSGLADYYGGSAVVGEFPPEAAMPQAEAAAKKALELDDLSAEAHLSMAAVQLFYRWNWVAAERESARAVELNPNAAEIHHLRSYALRPLNRMDEALQEQRKAMELDPFARPYQLGYALIRMRQFDAALNEARIRRDVQPNNADVHYLLFYVYLYKGMEKESEEELERYLQLAGEKDQLAEQVQVYRRGGFRAVLEWKVDVLKRKAAKQYVSPTDFADAYALLGRKEETIRYLEESYQERAPHLVFLQSDPTLDFLHSNPRYRAIVNKMGLPPAY